MFQTNIMKFWKKIAQILDHSSHLGFTFSKTTDPENNTLCSSTYLLRPNEGVPPFPPPPPTSAPHLCPPPPPGCESLHYIVAITMLKLYKQFGTVVVHRKQSSSLNTFCQGCTLKKMKGAQCSEPVKSMVIGKKTRISY